MNSKKIRWGIIGPGSIAKAFAGGVAHSRTGVLAAIATRNPGKAGLAESFPGARILDGYEALLKDPEVDAIYIATPHPSHAEWAIKAAEAGKHVLCEKPMGLTAFEAGAMIHAARKAGTFLGEAFMYRLHPQTLKLVELVKSGAIGEVRLIRSSFGFAMPAFNPEHRLYANDLAGGGILDVGGYPVSMARLIAGAAVGRAVRRAGAGGGHRASRPVRRRRMGVGGAALSVRDRRRSILQHLAQPGQCAAHPRHQRAASRSRISGSPAARRAAPARSTSSVRDGSEIVAVKEDGWLYSFEADAAGEAILAGKQELAWPGMGWADSLGNLAVLDKWRAGAGLEYGIEKPAGRPNTISGRKLKSGGAAIPRRAIPGLTPPASVVALGFEDFRSFSSGAILLDAFFEAGGNLFDTGFVYGGGRTEALLGEWMGNRGVREQSVVIGKGAHSPLCYPDMIGKQLTQSLDRMQTDHVDIYFMHRDNPDVPVGEFVDAMDAEVKAGRIRGPFGGSNWTSERMDEAIAYAEKNGKQKPGALSNNFSLAEMLDPIWPGCITSSSDEWKHWLDGAADAEFRLVEPGPRLLHRPRRPRQDRQ